MVSILLDPQNFRTLAGNRDSFSSGIFEG